MGIGRQRFTIVLVENALHLDPDPFEDLADGGAAAKLYQDNRPAKRLLRGAQPAPKALFGSSSPLWLAYFEATRRKSCPFALERFDLLPEIGKPGCFLDGLACLVVIPGTKSLGPGLVELLCKFILLV